MLVPSERSSKHESKAPSDLVNGWLDEEYPPLLQAQDAKALRTERVIG